MARQTMSGMEVRAVLREHVVSWEVIKSGRERARADNGVVDRV